MPQPSHAQAWQALAAQVPFALPETGAEVWLATDLLPNERFAVVRLPAESSLEVHSSVANEDGPLTISAWADLLARPGIVVNAGFYAHDGNHVGWLKAGGTWHTEQPRTDWYGLLLSGPVQVGLPQYQLVDILDRANSVDDPTVAALCAKYANVVQTMVLFDQNHVLRTQTSNHKAARTGIGIDRAGRLLIVFSERAVTLAQLAQALLEPSLGIDRALNMDGGLESQLAIRTASHRHTLLSRHGSRGEIPDVWFSRMPPRTLPNVIFATAAPSAGQTN